MQINRLVRVVCMSGLIAVALSGGCAGPYEGEPGPATNATGNEAILATGGDTAAAAIAGSALHVALIAVNGAGSGSVSSAPSGILCPSDCDQIYPPNISVTLSATANPGSVFGGWVGCPSPSGTLCTVPMATPHTVSAKFGCDSIACWDDCQDGCLEGGTPPGMCITICNRRCHACI
jgi:hypothetical protein